MVILLSLFACWASVSGAVLLMRTFRPGVIKIITCIVVVFSIGIQGMTLGKLVSKVYPGIQAPPD